MSLFWNDTLDIYTEAPHKYIYVYLHFACVSTTASMNGRRPQRTTRGRRAISRQPFDFASIDHLDDQRLGASLTIYCNIKCGREKKEICHARCFFLCLTLAIWRFRFVPKAPVYTHHLRFAFTLRIVTIFFPITPFPLSLNPRPSPICRRGCFPTENILSATRLVILSIVSKKGNLLRLRYFYFEANVFWRMNQHFYASAFIYI